MENIYEASKKANDLGLTFNDYNYLMFLNGSVAGAVFLAAVVYLSLKIGGR